VNYAEFFDTVVVDCESTAKRSEILQRAAEHAINLRPYKENLILVAFDETSNSTVLSELISIFTGQPAEPVKVDKGIEQKEPGFRDQFKRESKFLQHPVSIVTTAKPKCFATSSALNHAIFPSPPP